MFRKGFTEFEKNNRQRWKMTQIYLDCDGVLADFEGGAYNVVGMNLHDYREQYGLTNFWEVISGTQDFYANLDALPDAEELVWNCIKFAYVHHLPNPIILTACPWGDWAAPQKQIWKEKHFPILEMITTDGGENKYHHCQPGDILIDDYLKYKDLWVKAGGQFIHHINTSQSLMALHKLLNNNKMETYDEHNERIGGGNITA